MIFLKELKILKTHGIQYINDLSAVNLKGPFRGRPELSENAANDDVVELERFCPVRAIASQPIFSLDMGKCVFCRECQFRKPDIIRFTDDYKIASNSREGLVIRAGDKNTPLIDSAKIRKEIVKIFGKALKLRQVSAGGDNSCEMELNACGNVNFDMGRFGIEFHASPRHCDGIVVTGPVSQNMSEALKLTYEAVPSPKIVILAGVDAISGGLFADSPAIDRSYIDRLHVDLYVPGNPIHPLSFINGISHLLNIRLN
ncbi:MAG: NADH:ubiquinone oxidoreductase [Prevotellaceae bacterium]|jgi:Ni,Fe-hydrogenase III small subunit/ferredoxin|nr:NADH:ubiquinone oxidoreductase [Prevotellaceae bacterium]